MFKRLFGLCCLTLLSQSALAETTQTPTVEHMEQFLSQAVPDINVDSVTASPIEGVFTVTSGPSVFYVTADGQYVLYGELLQLADGEVTNLTAVTREAYTQQLLADLDEDSLIIYPATTDEVSHTLTIATDIDCVYCARLHAEVPALNEAGITVRYLAFPRTPPGTDSYEKAIMVWCADDATTALDEAFAGEPVTGETDCNHPLAAHMDFVREIGANATPTIILENGGILPGYVPAEQLIEIISTN